MQISKIYNYIFSHSAKSLQNVANPNFNGMFIYKGRAEASWSNLGGMGAVYHDRYEYFQRRKETIKQSEKELRRFARKASKRLPDNEKHCSYGILIDIHDPKRGFFQRYFDKVTSKR